MNLRDVFLQHEERGRYYSVFDDHVYFISLYITKEIRRYKIETDGTFSSICILLGKCDMVETDFLKCLNVHISSFDRQRYEMSKNSNDYNYYIELFRLGFQEAAKHKNIPLGILNKILDDFIANGCRNEWVISKYVFKDLGLKLVVEGNLTTNAFEVKVYFYSISPKKLFCYGMIARTPPNHLYFKGEFKKIRIENENIVFANRFNRDIFITNLDEIKRGIFNVKFINPFNSKTEWEDYNHQEILRRAFCYTEFEYPYRDAAFWQMPTETSDIKELYDRLCNDTFITHDIYLLFKFVQKDIYTEYDKDINKMLYSFFNDHPELLAQMKKDIRTLRVVNKDIYNEFVENLDKLAI